MSSAVTGALAAPGCWAACWPVAAGAEVGPAADVLAGLVGAALAEPAGAALAGAEPAGAGSVDVEPVGAGLAGEAELAAPAGAAVASTPTARAPAVRAARNERFTLSPPVMTD